MNEGQYMALRSYAEEQSSLLRQILDELKRQQGAAGALSAAATKLPPIPPEAVGPVTVETVETIETGKTDESKPAIPRREATEPVDMAVKLPAPTPNTTEPRAGGGPTSTGGAKG